MGADDFEVVDVASREQWRAWLALHHAQAQTVWLMIDKKNSTHGSLHYDDAVEEALCFGWIDSRARAQDTDRYKIMMSPRRKGSVWSPSNKERIERLAAAGKMTDAGWAAVETAKADGSWSSSDDIEALVIPEDLATALDADPVAKGFFESSPATARKFALAWIAAAKRGETRANRISEVVRLSKSGMRFDQR